MSPADGFHGLATAICRFLPQTRFACQFADVRNPALKCGIVQDLFGRFWAGSDEQFEILSVTEGMAECRTGYVRCTIHF